MNYAEFATDKKTIKAVIRRLEVLGEATKHIPAAVRRKHPDIPWKNMAAKRDFLIHNDMERPDDRLESGAGAEGFGGKAVGLN